ncbi:LysM peptidoglycan-binding domain-containing protein [Fluviispira vulneris]|uniref:LysM peptidoglycan-binding domain-containing protein n=1 Tax=Fluviispira vulneris TaxID=2763012 RepID=UPI0016490AED|nr:LysM peptidoglycan-binding domain-containing protein [Fluviispira vulneris]
MHIYLSFYKLIIYIILFISFSFKLHAFAESNFAENSQCTQYEVKDKETIIQILRKNSLIPVFGKEGSLQKTYEINNLDKKTRKELIHAGDKLCLPIRIRFPKDFNKQIVNDKDNVKVSKKTDENSNMDALNNDAEKENLTQKLEIEKHNNNKEIDNKFNNKCTTYTVKNGDTIIQILKTHKLRPIFGKNGSLQKTLKINKREGKKGYLIRPGNSLCLPDKTNNYNLADNKADNQEKNEDILKENKKMTEEILHLDSSLPIVLPTEDDGKNTDKNIDSKDKVITKNNDKIDSKDKYNNPNNEDLEEEIKQNQDHQTNVDVSETEQTRSPMKIEEKEKIIEKLSDKNIPIAKFAEKKRNTKIKPEKNKKKIDKEDINPAVQAEIQQCDKYTTEKEENIIHILRKKNMIPLFGENGSYQKTIELNKNLAFDNAFLEKGTTICLPNMPTTVNNKEKKLLASDNTIELEKNKNFEENPNLFYSELGVKYLRLKGENTDNNLTSTLLSRPIIFTEIGLTQRWNKDLETYFGINLSVTQIMQSDTNVVIGDSILRLTNILAGIKYNFYPNLYGNFQLSYGDFVVFRSINDTTLQVEKMSTTLLRSTIGYTFLSYDKLSFQSELSYLLSTPFTNEVYNAYIGQGYELGLVQSYNDKGWGFKTKLFYLRDYTYVPPVKFDYTEIGILFKFFGELP